MRWINNVPLPVVIAGCMLFWITLCWVISKLNVQKISCPKCAALTNRGSHSLAQIVMCVCLFPIGLLSLLGGRKPTVCTKCRHTWIC